MHIWWFISIIVYSFRPSYTWWWGGASIPWMETYHYPGQYTPAPSRYVNGSETMTSDPADTPDWRIEEPHFLLHKESYAKEMERPSRNSPPYKQSQKIWWARYWKDLEGILGGWYDTDANNYNASMYMTPARIHIHPMYRYDYEVNATHPIPNIYDLSLWAGTYPFYSSALLCPRAASSWSHYTSSVPWVGDVSVVAGFMFMKAYNRRPLPWFRYIVKTTSFMSPCPKSDWLWFHCIYGEYWGKYGFDSGGCMFGTFNNVGTRFDGLSGLCAFSMKLRSKQTVHYFTVIDCHPVLNFLYDAMVGVQKNVYLDDRFEDTKWKAPVPWWGENIYYNYETGSQVYYDYGSIPKYRR